MTALQHGSRVDDCPSLSSLLHNDLILRHISPYLGITSLVSIAASSKKLRQIIFHPQTFQYVDLSILSRDMKPIAVHDAKRESDCTEPLNDSLTTLRKHGVIQAVRTLILDKVNVSSEMLMSILCDDTYRIRTLSLRSVRTLSDLSLQRILRYMIRPGRPQGKPSLKALYYFQDAIDVPYPNLGDSTLDMVQNEGVTNQSGARLGAGLQIPTYMDAANDPYSHSAYCFHGPSIYKTVTKDLTDDWAYLLRSCRGSVGSGTFSLS